MDSRHNELRKRLKTMSPRKAVGYIESFGLPPDEAACLIECDVRKKSCVQAAQKLNMSVDGFNKLRRKAYIKLANSQE